MATEGSARFEEDELDVNMLDEVVGGFSAGVYGSVGYTGLTGSGGITIAVGVQSGFPFVTGGIYTTSGNGYSTGVSAGGSVGVFGATGNADSYFTGPGHAGALGVDAFGKVGVEGGLNSSGVSFGVSSGVGIGIEGVQVSGMQTEGTSVFASGGAAFNMNSSGPGIPTNSPQEYAGYFTASQSPSLDSYEPNSPELNSAINAINAGHTDDTSHADNLGHAHDGQAPMQEASGLHTDDPGHADTQTPESLGQATIQDTSPDHSSDHSSNEDGNRHSDDEQGMNDSSYFGNDFGEGGFGGSDFGGGDFG